VDEPAGDLRTVLVYARNGFRVRTWLGKKGAAVTQRAWMSRQATSGPSRRR